MVTKKSDLQMQCLRGGRKKDVLKNFVKFTGKQLRFLWHRYFPISKRYINHVTLPLGSADISILSLFESSKVLLINMVAFLMLSSELASLDFLKGKIF